MKLELHPSAERGHQNYGWLDTYHSFSFGEYFNPVREHFGALRVLNDDIIAGGSGFGEHPHNNMEIITIPLSGSLEHRDSIGHAEVIGPEEVQVMSAGTGILHSEYNHSKATSANFLQLWIYTRNRNVLPRYEQQRFDPKLRENKLQVLVSPDTTTTPGSLWIYQDAWISRASLSGNATLEHETHLKSNHIFVFAIEGKIRIANQLVAKRDALGIMESGKFKIAGEEDADILIIEIPDR